MCANVSVRRVDKHTSLEMLRRSLCLTFSINSSWAQRHQNSPASGGADTTVLLQLYMYPQDCTLSIHWVTLHHHHQQQQLFQIQIQWISLISLLVLMSKYLHLPSSVSHLTHWRGENRKTGHGIKSHSKEKKTGQRTERRIWVKVDSRLQHAKKTWRLHSQKDNLLHVWRCLGGGGVTRWEGGVLSINTDCRRGGDCSSRGLMPLCPLSGQHQCCC